MMNAVIYCRVSSRDQVEGTSLDSQEHACRDYAARNGHTVSRAFVEEGESAKYADRTELRELMAYCGQKQHAVGVLVVWKVDRLARNVEDHFFIKNALRKVGVSLVSVTEPIEDDPNGKLFETILAGFAQFDNDIRSVRTVAGLQAKLREGILPWKPPLGYLAPKVGRKIEPDRPDPLRFEPLCQAWKLMATGAYSKAAILRLLQSWGMTGAHGERISAETVSRMFRNPFYAGSLADPWTGATYPGRHRAMVTPEEFAAVQQATARRANRHPHFKNNRLFPLRGIVRCPSCEQPLSGGFAKGRTRRYAYYRCYSRPCQTHTRSYRADAVDQEFRSFLRDNAIPPPTFEAAFSKLQQRQAEQQQSLEVIVAERREQIGRLEGQLSELISMRTQQLISNDEFSSTRDRLTNVIERLRAATVNRTSALSSEMLERLQGGVGQLEALWDATPIVLKRDLGRILLPIGYRHGTIRTAERGLLLTLFGAFDSNASQLADLNHERTNTIMEAIHQFLSLVEQIRKANEAGA